VMSWMSVAEGVTANAVFVALTIGIGTVSLVLRRRALLRFWGLREVKKIRFYISHLKITQGGALDASGTPRSYQGSVVTQIESEMGGLLKSLFYATVPGRAVQPGWIQALLFVSADVEVQPAPGQVQQIDQEGTVVSLGSPGYNVVSGAIETNCNSPVKFAQDNASIQLPGNLMITNPRQSVVVRLFSGGRYWFYAAGLSEVGTAAAAYYLAKSWKRLDRRYRKSPSFFVALECSGNDYRNTRVFSEAAL